MSDFMQSYRTRLSLRSEAVEVLNLQPTSQVLSISLHPEHYGWERVKGVRNLNHSSACVKVTLPFR